MTTQREQITTLASGVTAADTTFPFSTSPRVTDNGRLSVGLEDVYVATGGSGSVTVIRGQYGSTAATHDAGDTVHVNPSWSNWEIAQAVNDELHSLSSPKNGLFRVRSIDFDYEAATYGYDLTGVTDLLDVWRVRYNEPGPENDWAVVPKRMWRVDQAADTTDFPTGLQVVLRDGGYPGQKVRVSYRARFDTLATLADDVETVSGLHASAHDILSVGAAVRLLSGLAAQRALTTTQPDPRRAVETQSRDAAVALVPLVEQRQERIDEEAAVLAKKYPAAI
jgi:hypothetical protein